MEKRRFGGGLLVCMVLVLLSTCSQEGDLNCDNPLNIGDISPKSNPPGYEVWLRGNGFGSNTEVRFDNLLAESRMVDENSIIAVVPSGLVGPVEITVSRGECLARIDFEVISDFPPGVPPNPVFIVIPPNPPPFPPTIPNNWYNLADNSHVFCFVREVNDNFIEDEKSRECHDSDPLLMGNAISGSYITNPPLAAYNLQIQVRRGADTVYYDGISIDPALAGVDSNAVLLFIERGTGRQLLMATNGNGTMDCSQASCN